MSPTGLVLVTGLDPRSSALADCYFDAVAQMRHAGPAEQAAYMAQLAPDPASFFDRFEDVAGRYWR